MGYSYDKKRKKESGSREKLDQFNEDIKQNCGINRLMDEGTHLQFTDNQGESNEEIPYSYRTFNLALSDYKKEENMEANDYYLFNQQVPEKEVNWEELIFGRNLEHKEKSVTRASSPALKEYLC
ncbi:hypothetical protein O181_087380 [Austropuccinia psidii MF-1]|uniref:Uncharacterized protein n=1 Tax=Austropuccinia psidii MF-1 TaxID=1389203 RepID=A0A9Q3IPJ1_9BASI|nr:hypothetical protein [Austropuccinia psidii MF-1]